MKEDEEKEAFIMDNHFAVPSADLGLDKEQLGCLPYEGEVFPVSQKGIFGTSCNGIVIKVTNSSVNSFMDWGGEQGRQCNYCPHSGRNRI